MKVILSRKGFDSANGRCRSPILPDGTMLSLPIPGQSEPDKYSDLQYNGMKYQDIVEQLSPQKDKYEFCHLDPDLRSDIRTNEIKDWHPAFGQIGAAQGTLRNANVEEGDLFLFFGWFRKSKLENGRLRFSTPKDSSDFYDFADLQAIYGYLQIGKIITNPEEISTYWWHPHASSSRINEKNNALYIPSESLSFAKELPGFGVLNFREDRVLTMKGQSRSVWNPHDFLMPDKVYGNKKNSAENVNGLSYAGIWQELIVNESPELLDWAKSIIL